MTEHVAIIDLGSNTARLVVLNIHQCNSYNLIYHQKENGRLSEGMEPDKILKPEAMSRGVATLKVFAHMCNLFKAKTILAVTTAAVRSARNGSEFVQTVEQETGIKLKILTEQEEAHLGYLGVINTIDIEDAVLFDLGGGSTQLTLIKNRKSQQSITLPFGTLFLTEKFGTQDTVTPESLENMQSYILTQLETIPWMKGLHLPLIGVGGTARNIAKMDHKRKNYPYPKVHNYRLGSISFKDLWGSLSKSSLIHRRNFPGLSSDRADVIVAGLTTIKCLFDIVQSSRLIISGCGLREGVFFDHLFKDLYPDKVIPELLTYSINNMLLLHNVNYIHAQHVTEMSLHMFDKWQDLHHLDARSRTLLSTAAMLHDIGITISYYDHPAHSTYLIENTRIYGLTHREQLLVAVIAGWHEKPAARNLTQKLYQEFFDEVDWETARKLSIILALAESLDITQMKLIEKITPSLNTDCASLKLKTKPETLIELQAVEKHLKIFKKSFNIPLVITMI